MRDFNTLLKIGNGRVLVFFLDKGKILLKNFTEYSNCHFVVQFYCHITKNYIFNQ